MHIRKSKTPKIEPSGTPASTDDQRENHQVLSIETYYLKTFK